MARLHDPKDWGSPPSAVYPGDDRNRTLKSQRCSEPVFLGEEGIKRGVYGFSADLYCPFCSGRFDLILVEFENAALDSSLCWGEINLEDFEVDVLKCPRCGYRDLEPL